MDTLRQRQDGLPRVIVVQHNPRNPPGSLRVPLLEGSDLTLLRSYADAEVTSQTVEALARSGAYDGVIVLGGPMGVYERDRYPFLVDSLRLLEDALEREAPVLGICLGAQMLSEVLGSPVYHGLEKGMRQEVGFFPLRVVQAGLDDPVVSLFSREPVLFWHRDTHDLPAGSTLLASTDLYKVASFRVRENVYGLQFHLETSADILQVWVSESPLFEESGADGDQILSEAYSLENANRQRAERLIRLFLGWAREYRARR